MQLGFVSAIFPELTLEEVFEFAGEAGFASVEVMCWPPGKAQRRYAGTTHIDASQPVEETRTRLKTLFETTGVVPSALGYYPNALSADAAEAETAIDHLRTVIDLAPELGLNTVTSFIGRDPARTVDANWPRFLEVWTPLIRRAEERGVRIGIENCPMLFSADEWPGGKNLATSPAIWRRMFEAIPSKSFGLNYDPSHMVWQQMDYLRPMKDFKSRLVHVHAKDARLDLDSVNDHGVLSYPGLWHTPKIPGMGDIHWGKFFGALTDAGYDGHVAIEVEDRAFEGSLEKRKEALRIAGRYLKQFIA
jgi:sugar phosphate isomerase/epimerase